MSSLLDQVMRYFDHDEWTYIPLADDTILQLGYHGRDNMWTCYAQTLEEERQFLFYSVAPVVVPKERRVAVAEYLTRANFELVLGNFEMDYDGGGVRYKTSIDVEEDRLSYALFRPIVYANITVMERYLPGLQSVVYDDALPNAAILSAEG